MRKYSCGFGKLPPFSQWVFDKSRVRLKRHECQEIGRFAQNLKKILFKISQCLRFNLSRCHLLTQYN